VRVIDKSKMVPVDGLSATAFKKPGELEEILRMAREAETFLEAHRWCRTIRRGYFDRGRAGIMAVFYFEIEPLGGADEAVWVIVGDVPPAYIDILNCRNGAQAVDGYVGGMAEWVERARAGDAVDECMPVYRRGGFTQIPATRPNAEMLAKRLQLIEELFLSRWKDELRK
jgi:hypothetical protein